MGSSPKAAHRTYLCFSALCHLYLHSAHGQRHPGWPTYNSLTLLSRLRTPTWPQLSAGRVQWASHHPPIVHGVWQVPLGQLASIMRDRADHQEAQETAEPGPKPCSLRLHHRRQIPDFTGWSEVRLVFPHPLVFLPVSIYTAWLFLASSTHHLP